VNIPQWKRRLPQDRPSSLYPDWVRLDAGGLKGSGEGCSLRWEQIDLENGMTPEVTTEASAAFAFSTTLGRCRVLCLQFDCRAPDSSFRRSNSHAQMRSTCNVCFASA
jgi:hypothetical protein